jgi:FixJ family two-component response regulator
VPKTAKISIIDDDDLFREAIKCFIRSLGYDVETFASAEEYLASDHFRDTSCIITDVQMPGMTGIDLQKQLSDDRCCTPIIFISASSAEKLRVRAMEAGAVGFLSKPFNVESLSECLSRALRSRRRIG